MAVALRLSLLLCLGLFGLSQIAVAQNTAPTIHSVDDQTTDEDTATSALSVTIGDAETSAASLTLSASSSDLALVPITNIVFGGSDATRTVTILPATNQYGSATITLEVSDGSLTASESFTLTVNPVNDPPFISTIANQTTGEDTATGEISFTITDGETSAASLTLSYASSNTNLIPLANMTLSGTDSSRTVNILPATNQYGSATITLTVSDGTNEVQSAFELTVTPANDPPTISDIINKTTNEDTATGAISFTVGDAETSAASLEMSVASSSTTLVPVANITFSGSGSNRTVSILPATNENGSATITLTVSDGSLTVSDSFTLTVTPVNDAPEIQGQLMGAASAPFPDNQPGAKLFTNIVILDVDHNKPNSETVTATVIPPATFAEFGAFRGFEGQQISFSGTPQQVSTQLQAVLFDPLPNRVGVGVSESFNLVLNAADASLPAPQNGARSVYVVGSNDLPAMVVYTAPSSTTDTQDVLPFHLAIEDPDPLDNTLSFTVTIQPVNDPNFLYGALEPAQPSFTGSKSFVETAVGSVRYRPVRNSVSSNQVVQFRFIVADAHNGRSTNLTSLTVTGANDPPDITGAAGTLIRITDDTNQPPAHPFPNVRIVDTDDGGLQPLVVSITSDDPAKGSLSQTTLSGTAEQVTTAIRSLTYQPIQRANRVLGETVTVTLSISVVDSAGARRDDSNTRIAITSVNGTPKISGIPAEQPVLIPPVPPIRPFAGVSISDDDPTNLTLTVSLDNPAKGYLTNFNGFVTLESGVYKLVTNAATATVVLANLQFVVSPTFLFSPSAPGGTTFTIQAVDSVLNTATKTLSILIQNEPRNLLVTRAEDDWQPGSLRHAVTNAQNNDVITFALSAYPAIIRLNHHLGPIELVRNVRILGPGADLLSLSGDTDGNGRPDTQLFHVLATVGMEGLTLTQGNGTGPDSDGNGGAIAVGVTGRLTLRYCAVTDSSADQWGGAIDVNEGGLTLEHCLVRGNSTDASLGFGGGAIALYTDEPCAFINTTFSANRQRAANGYGGGAIYAENFTPSTELVIQVAHCTFAENEDASENGTSINANVFGTLVRVRNSIFADGRGRNLEVQGSGGIISEGGNASDDSTRTTLTQSGQPKEILLLNALTDVTQAGNLLLPLDTYTGPMAFYPLSPSSPAIGLAVTPALAADQRGVVRDSDPDAGAAEFERQARVVLNELHFDAGAPSAPAQFLEFYIPRHSLPVNLAGFSVWVDGTNRHVFSATASSLVQPGHGILVADALLTLVGAASNATVVVTPSAGPLSLRSRGAVELRNPDNLPLWRVDYVGRFVDPSDPHHLAQFPFNSITLAPQFRGAALVPHSLVVVAPPPGGADLERDPSANIVSPGGDASPTPFGSPNAFPVAVGDFVVVGEDELLSISVLGNDSDADGWDRLVVVDVSQTSAQGTGAAAVIATAKGAQVTILPTNSPLRGDAVLYDPRPASTLQQLPVGAKVLDEFYYEIIDLGTGPIQSYSGTTGSSPITVLSPGHRLTNNDVIVISGSVNPSYNGEFAVTWINKDEFSIAASFLGNSETPGSWKTRDPRHPTARSESKVTITVLGANDPPAPGADLVATDEETVLRIMADPNLAGSATLFDTDAQYPVRPQIANASLLANDSDPDMDDHAGTLRLAGVVGRLNPISNYAGSPGLIPVVVEAPGHGLANGTVILISGYGGHPSYNAFHPITRIDQDTFSIPVPFVDNASAKGHWVVLGETSRFSATTLFGAAVQLELRADRIETSVVYNPRASTYLNGLGLTNGVPETADDLFYYAVEDSHGAVTLAAVTVRVSGVNDAPQPVADPGSLAVLGSGLNGPELDALLGQLDVLYAVTPDSSLAGRTDIQVQFPNQTQGAQMFLRDLWTTDEDTPLIITADDLLSNDNDLDRSDEGDLRIAAVAAFSREGASLQLGPAGSTVVYNPTPSARLNSLAREELLLDSFEITISDDRGGLVTSLVAVLVVGANDTPRATDDFATTPEDTALVLAPPSVLVNDEEDDIDGAQPDNQIVLVPVTGPVTPGGARVHIVNNTLTYDPGNSMLLDGLGLGQTFEDTFEYLVMDGSFIFANNDFFKVAADAASLELNVLANDRDYTGADGVLRVIAVTAPNQRGIATISAGGSSVLYTPEVNFVGDEYFAYTVSDEDGNIDTGLVTVRVTVDQLNGNLQANPDHFSVARGEAPLLDVLANDNMIPASGATLAITRIVSPPALDRVEIAGNRVRYIQEATGPFPYQTTFTCEISGGGTARALADVTVFVMDRYGTLTVRDDSFGVPAGSTDVPLDVLPNDNILPGAGPALKISQIVNAPGHGSVRMDAQRERLLYTPQSGFLGEDTLAYLATDGLGGTGTGQVRIVVGSLTVNGDFFSVPYDDPQTNVDDGPIELDVLANDRVLLQLGGTLTLVSVSPSATTLGTMTVKPDGSRLLFDPAAGQTGEAEFTYVLKDGAASPRTASGKVTVVVLQEGVRANADVFSVAADSTANLLDVLANDIAIPGGGQTLSLISIGSGVNAPNRGGTVIVAGSSLVYTPAPGFAGEETFTYTMTDARKTDTARVVVKVTSGALSANEDAFTVFFESANGVPIRSFNLDVLANDRVIPDLGQVLTITGIGINDSNAANAPDQQGRLAIAVDGASLIYIPTDTNGPFPYVERFTYEISDGQTRRAQAVVSVEVQQRANIREMETHDDAFTVQSDSQNNALNVLANDEIKPASALGWIITSVTTPAHGFVTISGPKILYTPTPGFVGLDQFVYTASDGFGGTGGAAVSVKVGDLPLSADLFTALSGSSGNVLDVLANDAVRPANAARYKLLSAGGASHHGALSTANNLVFYSPDSNYAGAYPYTETFHYLVEDDSLRTVTGQVAVVVYQPGSDRDLATLHITVTGVNDPPTISGTVRGITVNYLGAVKPFAGVTVHDVDEQGNQMLQANFSYDATRGGILNPNGFAAQGAGSYSITGTPAAISAALRGVVFAPNTGSRLVPDLTPPPSFEETFFALTVNDTIAPPVLDTNTSVIALHSLLRQASASNGTKSDQFGLAVGASRDIIAIGAPFHDSNGTDSGSVYVYARNWPTAGNWGEVTRLYAPDATHGALFGDAVSASGSTIVVGAPFARSGSAQTQSGAVYVFEASPPGMTNWQSNVRKLVPSDGAAGDQFGFAVSISGSYLAVGAHLDDDKGTDSGSVYIFQRDSAGNWVQLSPKLYSSDLRAGDDFGSAISLGGSTLVVGAPLDDDNGLSSGAAFVFERNSLGQWLQTRKLLPRTSLGANDGAAGDTFGFAVSVGGDIIAVGSPRDDDGGNDRGSAYVFARDQGGAGNWGQVKKLAPLTSLNNDQFGFSIAASRDFVVVGMPFSGQNNQSRFGSAYVFDRNQGGAGQWGYLERLDPPGLINGDEFGYSIALDGGTVAVGARADNDRGVQTGTAYLYELKFNNAPLPADAIPEQLATVDSPFSLIVPTSSFIDPDIRDSLVYSAALADGSPLPAWLTFDPVTRTLSGTPGVGDIGSIFIVITATDEDSASANATFSTAITEQLVTITVAAFLPAPAPRPVFAGGASLREFAFGTDAHPGGAGQLQVLYDSQARKMYLTYQRRMNDPWLGFTLEASPDLVQWSSAPAQIYPIRAFPVADDFERVILFVNPDFAARNHFFRVKANWGD